MDQREGIGNDVFPGRRMHSLPRIQTSVQPGHTFLIWKSYSRTPNLMYFRSRTCFARALIWCIVHETDRAPPVPLRLVVRLIPAIFGISIYCDTVDVPALAIYTNAIPAFTSRFYISVSYRASRLSQQKDSPWSNLVGGIW